MLHQVDDLFELNVKLRYRNVKPLSIQTAVKEKKLLSFQERDTVAFSNKYIKPILPFPYFSVYSRCIY